jgi:hypothetical protein
MEAQKTSDSEWDTDFGLGFTCYLARSVACRYEPEGSGFDTR